MATRRMVEQARALRRTMTAPEVRLWLLLRERPAGIRFHRQHPIGRYVLDFYCAKAWLAIEVDGMAHDVGNRPARDEARDRWLVEQKIATLRIPAAEVMRNAEVVLRHILECCALLLHHPWDGPPPHAEHGEEN